MMLLARAVRLDGSLHFLDGYARSVGEATNAVDAGVNRNASLREVRHRLPTQFAFPGVPGSAWFGSSERRARILSDFISEEIGRYFYNQGLPDAQSYLARFTDSMDADLAAARLPPRTSERDEAEAGSPEPEGGRPAEARQTASHTASGCQGRARRTGRG